MQKPRKAAETAAEMSPVSSQTLYLNLVAAEAQPPEGARVTAGQGTCGERQRLHTGTGSVASREGGEGSHASHQHLSPHSDHGFSHRFKRRRFGLQAR